MKSIKFSCGLLCTFVFCLPRFNERNEFFLMYCLSCFVNDLAFIIGKFVTNFSMLDLPSLLSIFPYKRSTDYSSRKPKKCYLTVLYVPAIKYICFVSQTGNKWASESSNDFLMAPLTVNGKMRLEKEPSDFKVSSLCMVPYYVLMVSVFFSIPLLVEE